MFLRMVGRGGGKRRKERGGERSPGGGEGRMSGRRVEGGGRGGVGGGGLMKQMLSDRTLERNGSSRLLDVGCHVDGASSSCCSSTTPLSSSPSSASTLPSSHLCSSPSSSSPLSSSAHLSSYVTPTGARVLRCRIVGGGEGGGAGKDTVTGTRKLVVAKSNFCGRKGGGGVSVHCAPREDK